MYSMYIDIHILYILYKYTFIYICDCVLRIDFIHVCICIYNNNFVKCLNYICIMNVCTIALFYVHYNSLLTPEAMGGGFHPPP